MKPPIREDDPARDREDRAPSPSARVRLEVELLANDQPVALPEPAMGDQVLQHTVLVIIEDLDVRQYVRECLRDRVDLELLEAPTAMAEQLTALHRPQLLIVDAHDAAVLRTVVNVRAVVIADDFPSDTGSNRRIVTLLRPFGGQRLEALIDVLLAYPD